MGYMPVITNLSCPLLDYASRNGDGFRFEAVKFASFAEMGEALRNGKIEAAFMIAPLAIVLRQQGEDIKVVYIGNRHESTLVARKGLDVERFGELAGKTVAVPMRYSGHNLCLRRMAKMRGMSGDIRIVEMNPPDMASAMAVGSLDAYFVGEPFAAQTVRHDQAEVLFYVREVWENFICNLLIVRDAYIQSHPQIVEQLVSGAVRAGFWAKTHKKEAADIAARYWNQSEELVNYCLTHPKDRVVFNRMVPKKAELQEIADLMVEFGLTGHNDISGLVAPEFARNTNTAGITDLSSILKP